MPRAQGVPELMQHYVAKAGVAGIAGQHHCGLVQRDVFGCRSYRRTEHMIDMVESDSDVAVLTGNEFELEIDVRLPFVDRDP
nr:hypothetical protein [Pseudomonas fildesensis]